MGEANELSDYLNRGISYMAYKTPEGVLKCHVYEGERFKKEMRLEDFVKEFNTLLLKYNTEANKDYWERLNQTNIGEIFFKPKIP